VNRVLFPASGFTTADAAKFYRAVAKHLLPHLKNVPLSFKRFPDTIRGESFWEKDAPSFTPKWVKTFAVPRRSGESAIRYVVANDARTLVWLAETGGIELHPFLHRTTAPERATSVVFDLDPGEGASIADCCDVALLLRDTLLGIGLQSFAKVSGSKGLQVYVPLNTDATHETTEPFARIVAEELARAHPKRITATMAKQLRKRKVFIDWSQNADYKTTVSVYSLRAKREAPYVSMPVTWEEVEAGEALDFDPKRAVARLRKRGDLWKPVLTTKQQLPLSAERQASSPVDDDEDDRRGRLSLHLPRPRSQSGRRLFVLARTASGDELWLDMLGDFKRWSLRKQRGGRLVAVSAGAMPIDKSFYAGEVPPRLRDAIALDDIGAYEVVEGSYARRRFDLWFSGKTLRGEWLLEKEKTGERWSFRPVA
jgi:bifunctional non-homologous end joining protein LigD